MAKYRVDFSGFAYVEAYDEETALEEYFENGGIYEESGVDSVELVDDFTVRVSR